MPPLHKLCQVCNEPAHGTHFGVASCKACSTFFRRNATNPKYLEKCEDGNCPILVNKWYYCKKCRLKKCLDVGMKQDRFQFNRDIVSSSKKILPSLEVFLGRPNFLLCFEPQNEPTVKTIIDGSNLIYQATQLLKNRSQKPYLAPNSLEKMTLNFENRNRSIPEFIIVKKFGKQECLKFWERGFLDFVNWMSYFDEFLEIPQAIQMDILKAGWTFHTKLCKLSATMEQHRTKKVKDDCFVMCQELCMKRNDFEMDGTWMTNYSGDQLKFFMNNKTNAYMDRMITYTTLMGSLNLSSQELNFMLCQLCLNYAGKQLRGDIQVITDKLMNIQYDNLHNYYINIRKKPNYSYRITQMMKINNMIMEDFREKREKIDLAKLFDVFSIRFTHPEMFDNALG